ncbi:MAG: hypothetical protein M9904_02270 [Chitinophagaceae bacterium]|nr:hypothetical protein [Chitinophagaceae bacterium]
MATPSFTNDQLVALEAAIAQGALVVEYADKRVEYRSLNEMLKIRDLMREALCPDVGNGNRRFAVFSKGFS